MFSVDANRIKKICNLIDSFLKYPFDTEVLKAYCLGFVMAIAIFSDLDMQDALDLNNYINVKVNTIEKVGNELA